MDILSIADLAHGAVLPGSGNTAWVALDGVAAVDQGTLDRAAATARRRSGILVGVSSAAVPDRAHALLEALAFTFAPSAPGRTWVRPRGTLEASLDEVRSNLSAAPLAAQVLDHVLHRTSPDTVEQAVLVESLAYSTLQAGPEFHAWLRTRQGNRVGGRDQRHPVQPTSPKDRLMLDRESGSPLLEVRFDRPARHNAFDTATRDGLLAALDLVERDASITQVHLRGNGRSFCSGGDLDEFGSFSNPVAAHLVRLEASAGLAVHRLRDRVRPYLHGACVGAGIEVPAFADTVTARTDAWFQLPELRFGLIPGAGGTASVRRRIGPWRTAWMAFSGTRVPVSLALEWGLVDDVA